MTNSNAMAAASALFIVGTTVYWLPHFIRRVGSRNHPHDEGSESAQLYRDEDGVATRESMSRYIVKPQKTVILLAALCGLSLSIASSGVCAAGHPSNPRGAAVMSLAFAADWVGNSAVSCLACR